MTREKRYDLFECSAHSAQLSELDWRLLTTLGAIWRARNAQERRIKAALARITDLGLVAS